MVLKIDCYENANVHSYTGISIDKIPNKCPFCFNKITPVYLTSYFSKKDCVSIFGCPDSSCKEKFIGRYKPTRESWGGRQLYKFEKVMFGNPEKIDVSENISEISEKFEDIYNQSFFAEQHDLREICGVGYRKAFEFLIKDYLIYNEEEESKEIDKIKNESLGRCIENRIKDPQIKAIAERAKWLGNDETHYVREFDQYEISVLKELIMLTIHWIEHEARSKKLIETITK